jgi:hypothetical protein
MADASAVKHDRLAEFPSEVPEASHQETPLDQDWSGKDWLSTFPEEQGLTARSPLASAWAWIVSTVKLAMN